MLDLEDFSMVNSTRGSPQFLSVWCTFNPVCDQSWTRRKDYVLLRLRWILEINITFGGIEWQVIKMKAKGNLEN